jgi:hypothetical protein
VCERAQIPAAFIPVAIVPEAGSGSPPAPPELAGVIEIEFAYGGRMRITGPVAASTVKSLIAVLTQPKGRRR